MAIEPLKIGNSAPSLNRLEKPQSGGILDINNIDKKDTRETEKDKKAEEKDKVTLSEQALAQINQNEEINQKQEVREVSEEELQTLKEAKKQLENDLVEFRGFNEVAKRKELTADDFSRISELRDNIKNAVGDKNISDDKILEKADELISELAGDAEVLLDNLANGSITGNQFDKLDKINSSLNKANGFGNSFEADVTVSQDTTQVRKDFSKSLESIGDRRLSEKEISLLKDAQKQLSAIDGFRINVRDRELVGAEGLVA